MRTIFSLSDAGYSLLLILLFFTFSFQLFVCCVIYFSRAKWVHCKALSILTAVSLLSLSLLSSGTDGQISDKLMVEVARKIMDIPAMTVFVFVALAAGYAYWILLYEWKYRKSAITRGSVREGADLMPMGLCFFKGYGQPILVNIKMNELSHLLCGEGLQNGESFWHTVSEGNLKSGARRSSILNVPAVILQDGKAWIFDRQKIYLDGEEIIQVTAMDATELYCLSNRLKEENLLLRNMNTRLKMHKLKVYELTRTQHRLAMKIQIHDSIGQNLMMTRYYLTQEDLDRDPAHIIRKWQQTIALLRLEVEHDKLNGTFKYLTDAAESAGVEVVLQGEMPQENRVVELITAAGAEALTNAVRHADAKKLKVKITWADMIYGIEFTNDGRKPEQPFREGGGLMEIRRRIENEGGTMTVSADSNFSLVITNPKERQI